VAATVLAAAGFLFVPGMILAAPLEPVMGFVQKIFYFHVPCATMLFLSTFACAAGSVASSPGATMTRGVGSAEAAGWIDTAAAPEPAAGGGDGSRAGSRMPLIVVMPPRG